MKKKIPKVILPPGEIAEKYRQKRNFVAKFNFNRGGGHKRRYRQIDFKRYNLNGHVRAIEYDPNRSAHLARVFTSKGNECYIIAPENLTVGMPVFSGGVADIKLGNSLRVRDIPVGTFIHNIEINRSFNYKLQNLHSDKRINMPMI